MNVRVLGCHGGELPGHRTTCFLIDGKMTVDGGAMCQALQLKELLAIDDILLTHSHPDHAGSARELANKWGCPVFVHPNELLLVFGNLTTFKMYANPLDRAVIFPLLHLVEQPRR